MTNSISQPDPLYTSHPSRWACTLAVLDSWHPSTDPYVADELALGAADVARRLNLGDDRASTHRARLALRQTWGP